MAYWAYVGRVVTAAALVLGMTNCGGGSGDGEGLLGGTLPDADDQLLTWQQGVFFDKAFYQNKCANPRTGNDPFNNNEPFPDEQGTAVEENFFLRSWTNDLYFWYDEVLDRDPGLYSTADYFTLLKTEELTPSGNPKDNFHFSQNTEEYNTVTFSGEVFGYGMNLIFESAFPPRSVIVRDVIPGSPADLAGVTRGMSITEIDGVDVVNGGDTDTLNAGISPTEIGEDHDFIFIPAGSSTPLVTTLTSARVETVPVQAVGTVDTPTGTVGFMHFSTHSAPSEQGLYDAFTTLSTAGVSDLVLDLRYNGGGFLAIAGQVGYMVAGNNAGNAVFYQQVGNDKQTPNDPLPFFTTTLGFATGLASDQALPTLNLDTVYVLASGGTCSASEAIINGLRGINVDVVLIGDTTCGKPYGFFPQDNCGTTYFSVQFAGVNDLGFGEFPDGFSPANMPDAPGVPVAGCWVEDDVTRELGDPQEAMFAAALQYRENGTCPTIPSTKPALEKASLKTVDPSLGLEIPVSPGLNNAILTK